MMQQKVRKKKRYFVMPIFSTVKMWSLKRLTMLKRGNRTVRVD